MNIEQIDFGSFLTYSPRGNTEDVNRSRTLRTNLKRDSCLSVESKSVLTSEYFAGLIKEKLDSLKELKGFFNENTILIPIPSSSLSKVDSIWIPERLAKALIRENLGKEVRSCLRRAQPVTKSSTAKAENRPKAIDHYDSMTVEETLDEPKEILMIDDIVTRGATFLGAANKLAETFPNTKIRGFAFMRTISKPEEFERIKNPCTGTIELKENGETYRKP